MRDSSASGGPWLVALATFAALAVAWWVLAPAQGLDEVRHLPGGAGSDPREALTDRVEPGPDGELLGNGATAGSGPDGLEVLYRGWIRTRHPGTYAFEVESSGETTLRIEGRGVAEPSFLAAGLHRFELEVAFTPEEPNPQVFVRWAKDVPLFRPIPAKALYPGSVRTWRFFATRAIGWILLILGSGIVAEVMRRALGPARARRAGFALMTIAGSIVLSLMVLEGGFRVFGVRPLEHVPADVWLSRWWTDYPGPGETLTYTGWLPLNPKEFEVEVKFNRMGWRDHDYPTRKPDGTHRVLVIGDSYVEAKEVPLEETFHKLLESRLRERFGERSVDVIALGQGGTGTVWHLPFLRDPGLAFEPDLVVLCFFPGNDVLENSEVLGSGYLDWLTDVYTPYVVVPKIAIRDWLLVVPGSWLNHFLVDRAMRLYHGYAHLFHRDLEREELIYGVEVYGRGPYDAEWTEAWQRTEEHLVAMRDLAKSHGAEFLVLIAHSIQVPGFSPDAFLDGGPADLDLLKPTRITLDLCRRHSIACLDLEPRLSRHVEETGERYYWEHDAHWNETGHRIAADALYGVVASRVGTKSFGSSGGEH